MKGGKVRNPHSAGGPGSAPPRPLVSTHRKHQAFGTVADFDEAPVHRIVVSSGAVRPEDRARFKIIGQELHALGVPDECRDGGPVDPFAVEQIITRNAAEGRGKIRYPFYDRDCVFEGWRAGKSGTVVHRAHCLVMERWVLRAMSNATPAQMLALQRLHDAAEWNLIGEDNRRATQVKAGKARAAGRGSERAHHVSEYYRLRDDPTVRVKTKAHIARKISEACKAAKKTECAPGTVLNHLKGA